MADLLAEVDDAMRQEKMEKFFKDYGGLVIALIIGIILATAAWSGYKAWNTHVRTTQTAEAMQLLEAPGFPANINPDSLDMRADIKALVLLNAAGNYMELNKPDKARAMYVAVTQTSSAPKDLKDLANLMIVRLPTENQKNQDKLENLKTIWADTNSPWRYHAFIEAATIEAAEKNFDQAAQYLNIVLDTEGLLNALYTRAEALNHVYALKKQTIQKP